MQLVPTDVRNSSFNSTTMSQERLFCLLELVNVYFFLLLKESVEAIHFSRAFYDHIVTTAISSPYMLIKSYVLSFSLLLTLSFLSLFFSFIFSFFLFFLICSSHFLVPRLDLVPRVEYCEGPGDEVAQNLVCLGHHFRHFTDELRGVATCTPVLTCVLGKDCEFITSANVDFYKDWPGMRLVNKT